MEVSRDVEVGVLEDVDFFCVGVYADELVADAVGGVEVSVCAFADCAAEGGAVGYCLGDSGEFDCLWAQRGCEGDWVFVNFARVGVDAEDDVFEDALE